VLASYNWLCELQGFAPDPQELADRFTFSGLEVDDLRQVGVGLDGVVVGRIESRKSHPEKESWFVGVESEGMVCSELELDIGPDQDGILILDGETDSPPGTPIAEALGLDDWIFELSVTPNRPDALSHRGLAREACVLYDKPFAPPAPETALESGPAAGELATVELVDAAACPRYMAAVLTGLQVRPSPFGLRYRLHRLGVRPISNLVDVTNLMLLEHGQPLHAFDLDRVAGKKIVVRAARDGEKMVTLDEVERTFTSDDLLICDGERPVAVAGVMGGEETGIGDHTENLLIECAYFTPSNIRRTSKRLKLSSESSYRFERGIDPAMGPDVLAAASSLAVQLAGGVKAPGLIDEYPSAIEPLQVTLRPARYEQVIGRSVEPAEMRRILGGLGAEVGGTDDELEVRVPTGRPDIEREIDLIEEVARVRGYAEVEPVLPRIQCLIPDRPEHEAERRSKEVLASLGLDEAISYSFVPEAMLDALGLEKQLVRIANPLNAERATMRPTLIVGLLESLKRALSRFVPALRQFEVGRTFHDLGDELPQEVLRAAVLLSGPRGAWIGESRSPLDLYDAKGLAVTFIDELIGVEPDLVPTSKVAYLHPKRALELVVDGRTMGVVGEIHPAALSSLKLPRGVVALEVSVLDLWQVRQRSSAVPIPEYPPMVRDVALMVDEQVDAAPVQEALRKACGELAVDVRLFDVYRGKGVDPGKKSLAFSVVYRAADRTLTDEEVDTLHKAAVEQTTRAFSAVVR
jgi:phenylalanyl-tRNA synthetase beta chain